jgi:signal transduction histidine kinase/CheY-like chemotaxis protein
MMTNCMKVHNLYFLLTFFFSATFALPAVAPEPVAHPVRLGDVSSADPIGKHVMYLRDPTGQLSFSQVSGREYRAQFRNNRGDSVIVPLSQGATWLQFSVENELAEDAWLDISNANLATIDFYALAENGLAKNVILTGALRPARNRAYDINTFWLPLNRAHESTPRTYFVRVTHPTPITLILHVGTLRALHASIQTRGWLTAGFIAILLTMFLYNAYGFMMTRDRIYVTYLAHVIMALFSGTYANGYPLVAYLSPSDEIAIWWHQALLVWHPLTNVPIGLFCIQYLNLRKNNRFLKRLIYAQIIGTAVFFPTLTIAGFNPKNLFPIYQLAALAMPFSCLVAAIYIYTRKDESVRFYLVGWGIYAVCLLFYLLALNGILPYTTFWRSTVYVSIASEVVLFSLALSDRLNLANRRLITHSDVLMRQASKMVKVGGWEYFPHEDKFHWSESTREIHHAPPDFEPTRKNSFVLYRDRKSRHIMSHAFSRCLAQGTPYDIELKLTTLRGEVKWIRTIGEADFAGGVCRRIHGTCQDITEQKETESKLREATRNAEAASVAKSEFLSTMSHEIRTPMSGLIGMASFLSTTTLDKDQKHYVDIINKSSANLLHLIDDILDFSRIEAGRLTLTAEPFDPVAICNEVCDLMSAKAAQRGNTIERNFDPELSYILVGDEFRIKQVISNLVSNAVKFTEDGVIRVSARHIVDRNGSKTFEICVTDTGIGIPADKVDLLFKPFTQADGSVTRRYGGSGLGLSICQRIVDKMQGKIFLESKQGEGTKVRARLSLPQAAAGTTLIAEGGNSISSEISEMPAFSILVVDDDEILRTILVTMLESLGHTVEVAADGLQALGKFAKGKYDLITMDTNMPHLGGHETIARIRELSGSFEDPVIISLSATADTEASYEAITVGANDILNKPFTLADISQRLEKWAAIIAQSKISPDQR